MANSYSPLEQETLRVAKTLIGKKEATGKNDGWIARLCQRWVDPLLTWMEAQPWCVCFVGYCIYTAAKKLGLKPGFPRTASSSTLYDWYKRNGLLLKAPKAGCVGIIRAGVSSSRKGKTHVHTFLVHAVQVKEGKTYVIGVDGNYHNAVQWSKRPAAWCDFGPIL